MLSNYLPINRRPPAPIAASALAALLFAAFSQASSASDTAARGSEPHWSSRIGTGQPFDTDSEPRKPRATSAASGDESASIHWSARIGTGRAVAESRAASVVASIAGVPAPAHWSALIGTGQASPAMNVRKASERNTLAEISATAEPMGDHPAALVAQTWSKRGIDPNTFIVLHPAGAIWVDTSLAATEEATPDTASYAARTAIASNKITK